MVDDSMVNVFFLVMVIYNTIALVRGVTKRISYEIYTHTGMLAFFTVAWIVANPTGSTLEKAGIIIATTAAVPFIPAAILNPWKGRLITHGIYRYVRHPMYLTVFILCFGVMLCSSSVASVATFAFLCFCSWMAQKKEEEELLARFGSEYEEYMRKVPRLNIVKGYYREVRRKSRW